MWPNPQETADLVTFTEEILIGKLHFLCSANINIEVFAMKCLFLDIYVSPECHFTKIIRLQSFWGQFFPAFGLNMEIYSVYPLSQSEYGKIRTWKTPNRDTFHLVYPSD